MSAPPFRLASAPGGPRRRARWAWLLLLVLVAYGLALEVRLAEIPKWERPEFRVAGEYLAATHDSYAWLAGAGGLGDYVHYPFSRLTRALEQGFGARPGNVAFWAPAFFAALAAPVTLLWGWLLGGRTAGLAAGLLGAILPGFYIRTRLGYWDTDVFTLLGPLTTALCLAAVVREVRRPDPAPADALVPAVGALLAGLLCRVLDLPHQANVSLGLLTLALAVPLLLALARGPALARGLRLLAVFGLAAFPGWQQGASPWRAGLGLVLAILLVLLPRLRSAGAQRALRTPWPWLAALAVLVLAVQAQDSLLEFLRQGLGYLRPADNGAPADGPVWPGVTQSIREVLVMDIPDTLARLGGSAWAGGAGLACLPLLFVLRPEALLLLPTLGLGLCSLWLGNRFSMYGGPAVVLGLGVCLDLGLRRVWPLGRGRETAALALQCGLALTLVLPLAATYRELPVSPVLDQVHAEALVELGRQAPPGALVWTWWDYGYATQYYARRRTALDGGRHAGREVYPLALALTTPSARQAAQVLRLAASPEPPWTRGTGAQARDFLDRLTREDVAGPQTPPQYLVVAWEDLNLARWITFYGRWDLLAGQSRGGEIMRLRRDADIDPERGVVALRHSGEIVRLGSMEVFTGRDVLRRNYAHTEGTRLVLNAGRNEAFLLGEQVWRGMLLRLLLDDPGAPDIAPHFRLAVDRFPDARIYEVR